MGTEPLPTIEILTARLLNELAEDPSAFSEKDLEGIDEDFLNKKYGDKTDFPNKVAKMTLRNEDYYASAQQRLQAVMSKLKQESPPKGKKKKGKQELDFTDPQDVKQYLDQFVEGQDESKKILSAALVDYLRYDLRRGILLLGPSGAGKTYTVELLCKKAGIPFVKKSLANVTTEGFKGQNLSEGLEDLVGVERAILFLDEFDKVVNDFGGFGSQLQNELLAYFTGEKIKLSNLPPQVQDPEEEQNAPGRRNKLLEQLQQQLPDQHNRTVATIYNVLGRIEDDNYDSRGGKIQSYLQSLNRYFTEKGIAVQLRDLTSNFEDIPPVLKDAIKNIQKEYSGSRRRYYDEDEDYDYVQYVRRPLPKKDPFIVELGGQVLLSPTRSQLDSIVSELQRKKAAEEQKKQPEEKKEIENEETEGPEKEKKPTNVVDLGKILIVAAGAFHGGKNFPSLYNIIQRRLGGNTCKLDETELLQNVEDRDLIEYGLKAELVGRLQARAVLRPHGVDGLYRILKYNEDSPLDRLKKIFDQYGITLYFDDPALLYLAQCAHKGIGVRGLHKVLDNLTYHISFERCQYLGRTLVFTRSDLEKKLKKEVEFRTEDRNDINWEDISSILAYLNHKVPGQEEAKEGLARAFHLYHLRTQDKFADLELPLSNILLIGPTGSGKTYMVKLLAERAGLPIASTNTTGKVPEGFSGSQQLTEVFEQFSQDQKYGIVYIDEVDKVLLHPENPLNDELIGFLEDGEVRGRKTKNYLFILSGAFQNIYNGRKQQGIEQPSLTRDDLIEYGVKEEILGRIPLVVTLYPPSVETMVGVLQSDDSILQRYRNYFSSLGYTLNLEEGVLEMIAEKALASNFGFRALKTVGEQLFGQYMINQKKYLNPKTKTITITYQDADCLLTRKRT